MFTQFSILSYDLTNPAVLLSNTNQHLLDTTTSHSNQLNKILPIDSNSSKSQFNSTRDLSFELNSPPYQMFSWSNYSMNDKNEILHFPMKIRVLFSSRFNYQQSIDYHSLSSQHSIDIFYFSSFVNIIV